MNKLALSGSKRFLTLMTLDIGSCDADMCTTVSVPVELGFGALLLEILCRPEYSDLACAGREKGV